MRHNCRSTIKKHLFKAGVLLILALFCTSCAAKTDKVSSNPWDAVKRNEYSAEKFSTDYFGMKHYSGCSTATGVDISEYNDNIDWGDLSERVDYCIVRVGYRGRETGLLFEDALFEENMKNAREYGIDTGVYFFSAAITPEEAEADADFVISKLKGYDITYPVAFDMEITPEDVRNVNMTMSERTACTVAFCEKIKEAGYTPCVYGNPNWFYYYVHFPDLCQYKIWLAEYNEIPEFKFDFDYWQYSMGGAITSDPDEYYDLNLCFKK